MGKKGGVYPMDASNGVNPVAVETAELWEYSTQVSSSVRSVCKPIPSTLILCHGIGYKHMWIPNLLGHDTMKEIQKQSATWLPLVSKLCHRDTERFLCSLFAPVCLPELSGPVYPCKSMCERVQDGCLPVMSAFGFPWPEMLNCSRFPGGQELCIPAAREQELRTAEEALEGKIICEACGLSAEGENDIQENFCRSPYAFKMRFGSLSKVGRDLQLVPTPHSQILRWAGEGAEKVANVGGAVAYSPLWLQDGATCNCPGLDSERINGDRRPDERQMVKRGGNRVKSRVQSGWYLGLAQIDERRLVLTQLVKWTRGEKELKKFVRVLLKNPCPKL
ncbi:secreted frizzled-related protein 2-like [Pholidichthys leucotaenia]